MCFTHRERERERLLPHTNELHFKIYTMVPSVDIVYDQSKLEKLVDWIAMTASNSSQENSPAGPLVCTQSSTQHILLCLIYLCIRDLTSY